MSEEIQWKQTDMVEVVLNEPDDFLKVRETLTRIGVASRKERKRYQSCHILHKQGRYYIVHFKELFALDGKKASISLNDVQRRNRIVQLLVDWGLVSISSLSQEKITDEFEVMISSLTFEELIGLRLELAAKSVNHKLFGFKIWLSLPNIIKDAVLKYTYSAARTNGEAASFLGISKNDYNRYLKKFKIKEYFSKEN